MEKETVGTTPRSSDATGTRTKQSSVAKTSKATIATSGSTPKPGTTNFALAPQTKETSHSRDSRLQGSRSGQRDGELSSLPPPASHSGTLPHASSFGIEDLKEHTQKPVGGRQHHKTEKGGDKKHFVGEPQNFKIYTRGTSPSSRPKTVAMNVPVKSAYQTNHTSPKGIYVPRNAASGLTKTTTQGVKGDGRLPSKPSQRLLLVGEANTEPASRRSRNRMQKTSQTRSEAGTTTTPASDDRREKPEDAKTEDTSGVVRRDEAYQKVEDENRACSTTRSSNGSQDAQDILDSNDECAERKQRQRRTLRAKISNMMLMTRKAQDEEAVPLSEDKAPKPAVSRRKSVLSMFK
jgi:hypothetical protein